MAAWLRALEGAALVGVLLFVGAVAYLPHTDAAFASGEGNAYLRLARVYEDWLVDRTTDDYEYTVHVDENMHWARMAGMERAETLRFQGPFSGLPDDRTPLELRGIVHERGFYYALLELKLLTGIEWIQIIRFLPAMWAAFTAFTVWAALRPWPGALVAAALVALIPTSARFLGPGFLVPIGFGMAWIAGGFLFTGHIGRRGGLTVLLVLLTIWAFFIHLIAGFALVLLLLCAIPFERRIQSAIALLLTAMMPVVAMIELFREGVIREIERVGSLPIDLTVFDQIGIAFLAAWAIGGAIVVMLGRTRQPPLLFASLLASVVALGFIVTAIASRSGAYAIYDRWHQPFVLLAAPVAAAALVQVATWIAMALRRVATARVTVPVGVMVGLVLTAAVAQGAVGGHLDEPYYRVLDDREYAAFRAVATKVNASYDVFLAEPWSATILAAMSGKTPHAYLTPGNPPVNGDDWDAFLAGQRFDAAWLAERDISFVVTTQGVAPEFQETAPSVHQLEWEYARELDRLR